MNYEAPQAKEFYSKISQEYDSRNTKFLQEAHLAVAGLINSHIEDKTLPVILDLGGGTGNTIASQFFLNANVTWHYVDASDGMRTSFEKNAELSSFNYIVKNQDIKEFLVECNKRYDVIVLSFVLTSLDYKVDIYKLSKILKPNGILIIADIEPEYTFKKPNYSVKISNEVHSLKVSPASPIDIISRALDSHLQIVKCQSVKRRNQERYAYILVFSNST